MHVKEMHPCSEFQFRSCAAQDMLGYCIAPAGSLGSRTVSSTLIVCTLRFDRTQLQGRCEEIRHPFPCSGRHLREGLSLTTGCPADSETKTYPQFSRSSHGPGHPTTSWPCSKRTEGPAQPTPEWRTPTRPRVSYSPILASWLYFTMRFLSVASWTVVTDFRERWTQDRALLSATYRSCSCDAVQIVHVVVV